MSSFKNISRYLNLIKYIALNVLSLKLVSLLVILIIFEIWPLYFKELDIIIKNNLNYTYTDQIISKIFNFEIMPVQKSYEYVQDYENGYLKQLLCCKCKTDVKKLENCKICHDKLKNLFSGYHGDLAIQKIKGINEYNKPYLQLKFSFKDFFYKLLNPLSIIVFSISQEFRRIYYEQEFEYYLKVHFRHLSVIFIFLLIICNIIGAIYYHLLCKLIYYTLYFKLKKCGNTDFFNYKNLFIMYPNSFFLLFLVTALFYFELFKKSIKNEFIKTIFFILIYTLFIRLKRAYIWVIYLPLLKQNKIGFNMYDYVYEHQKKLKEKEVLFIKLCYKISKYV